VREHPLAIYRSVAHAPHTELIPGFSAGVRFPLSGMIPADGNPANGDKRRHSAKTRTVMPGRRWRTNCILWVPPLMQGHFNGENDEPVSP
jgi:hypothetical protein